MVKKIVVCVSVFFLAIFFSACSSSKYTGPKEELLNLVSLDHDWTQSTKGETFPWDDMDGFFPSNDHPYGFDRHPNPEVGEDSIVHVSVLNGDYGKITLKINQDFGSSSRLYDYYICESAYPYGTIAIIDNSKKEFSYTITAKDKEKKLALCRESETGIQKVQELNIHPYEWNNNYDFYVYIMGDKNNSSARHQLLNSTNFWNFFDSVYSQAVVKHRNLFGEFVHVDRGYIMTRAEYDSFYEDGGLIGVAGCPKGGGFVSETIDEIVFKTKSEGHKRNIIQVGYPTKRFWPLIVDEKTGYIRICGKPASDQDPTLNSSQFNLELETLSASTCLPTEASVIRDENRKVWKLRYKDGRPEEDATINNIKPNCMVFAEVNLGNYVADSPGGKYDGKTYVAVLPWLGDFTAKMALHELGHAMGLEEIIGFFSSYMGYNDEGSSIMDQDGSAKFLNLRKRGLVTKYSVNYFPFCSHGTPGIMCMEQQWDCLHKVKGACVDPFLDPYYQP